MGFQLDYWNKIYKNPETIDGLDNNLDHAYYLFYFFKRINYLLKDKTYKLESLIDFGFGTADLLKGCIQTLKPKRVIGLGKVKKKKN